MTKEFDLDTYLIITNCKFVICLFNTKNLKRVSNSLIYTGQQLNKIRTQTLSSNNGGNLRSKTQNNYRITTNPNDPLIGIRRKITHHEIIWGKY